MDGSSGADSSSGYYAQTRTDPVVAAVIRKLESQVLTITSEDGTRIWIRGEDLKPLLAHLTFAASRKGMVWARLKKKKAPLELELCGAKHQNPTTTTK